MIFAGEEFADEHDRPIPTDKDTDPVNFARLEEPGRRRVFEHVARLVRLRREADALAVNERQFLNVDLTAGRRVFALALGGPGDDPVVVAALILDAALGTGGVIYALALLGLFLPNLAVSVRRLHDSGHSGWWLLISIVPLIGLIVVLVFTLQGSAPPNKWGHGPDDQAPEAPALA